MEGRRPGGGSLPRVRTSRCCGRQLGSLFSKEMEKQPEAPGFGKLKWQEEKQPKARPGRFSQERLEMKSRREEAPLGILRVLFFSNSTAPSLRN